MRTKDPVILSESSADEDGSSSLSSARMFAESISLEDLHQCLYVSKIDWRRRFSIRRSSSSADSALGPPVYLSRYRNSSWFRSQRSQSTDSASVRPTLALYARLRRFHQRLDRLERQVQGFSPMNGPAVRKRSLEQLSPPDSKTRKLRRTHSSPQLLSQGLETLPSSVGGRTSSLPGEKQVSYEIQTKNYNRKVQVITKQEERICSSKSVVSRVTSHESSPVSRVRVRVSSSPVPVDDDDETFDRRPLLNLINELHRRQTALNSLDVLPPRSLSPFQPVIVQKKSQEALGRFDLPTSIRRVSVMRSHTFNTPSHECSPSLETLNCQSTPDLNSNNALEHLEESTGTTSTNAAPLLAQPATTSATNDEKNEAKRKAIAMQMYDTEKSYVEALKNLVTKYYLPMKDKAVISNDLVHDIFYKIPEIHIHHTAFLISISQKLSQWDNKQTIGDLFLQTFTKATLIETYTSFVNNYKTAQIAIRLCRDSSSFNKFLEQQARDHRGKLTLRDLIIQPVQRIPRYELYIKDFLKSTHLNHPDYQLLLKAQSEIHSLAEQIDQVQREVGSTDLAVPQNSLDAVQEMIENLTDLVQADRFYIRHDVVTLQSPSGLKKDRCLFLFNDLILITSCKRRSGTLTKKSNNPVIVNSPSGKQYIDNAKHKLIMKIPLESVDLAADHGKKVVPPSPSMVKSQSAEKTRHLEDDVLILSQMTDMAKTITIAHLQLDDSLKEMLNLVNKHLSDEFNARRASPEPSHLNETNNATNVQLTINTPERTETIDVLFLSSDYQSAWKKSFLEAKKALFEIESGRRTLSFEHVLALPNSRPGNQFSCGSTRASLGDICICNCQGQICLVNIHPEVTLKACNTVVSSRISCVAYVPSHKGRRTGSSLKHRHPPKDPSNKETKASPGTSTTTTTAESLFDIDSSDEEETTPLNTDEHGVFDGPGESILLESDCHSEQQDTREATMWIGTDDGVILIFQCPETSKTLARKSRIVKQLGSAIHSILYTDNKVFVALSHGELCVFRRDMNGRWDLDCPIIRSIDEDSTRHGNGQGEFDEGENLDPISVMALAAGKLWCAIRDRIFVVCPNSLTVQHSFVVDDCHRHVSSIASGGASMHHVWIASQGSHEIRLYHGTHYSCLLETSIRTAVTQKLNVCDDIIRAHKLGCLHVTALHICKETLWIGTSAGVLINLTFGQMNEIPVQSNAASKLTGSSLQLKGLAFGHAGPVRFILSTDTPDEGAATKTLVLTIGDGFEDYANNDETLGKDDGLSHLIVWQL